MKLTLLASAVLIAATLAPAQDVPYTLQVNAREVVTDIVAIDSHGHPVTGLQPGDFRVVEDGVPQTVRSLAEHTPEPNVSLSTSLGPNEFANVDAVPNGNAVTVILIDALETPVEAQMYVRQQLIRFFRKMPAGHTFAIFQMDTKLRLVQGFSADPKVLLAAVQGKREMPSLHLPISKDDRKRMLLDCLYYIDRYLEAFPGRKNFVWFTGAVPGNIVGLSRNPFRDSIDYNRLTGQNANAISLSRVAIYPIDGRGLSVFRDFQWSHADMQDVAEKTGGKAFFNTNGLDKALTEITETSSDYYTLAYAPTNTEYHAHHRDVHITVVGHGKVTLLYRNRYYAHKELPAQKRADAHLAKAVAYDPNAAPPPAAPDTPPRPLESAMELGSIPAGELLFSVKVDPAAQLTKIPKDDPLPPHNFLADDYAHKPFRNFHVKFTLDANRIAFQVAPNGTFQGIVTYVVVVFNQDGQEVNSQLTTSQLVAHNTHEIDTKKAGISLDIAIPDKGSYFLRIGLLDNITGRVGALEIPTDTIHLPAS